MSTFSQTFPPAPAFTEDSLPDLQGKVSITISRPFAPFTHLIQVYIVTGAASGVGLALGTILHGKNATVYIGARSLSRCSEGIKAIQATHPSSHGRLEPLVVDLADLENVKTAADEFLTKEDRLDVLVHNAGVMVPPTGSKSKLVRVIVCVFQS